MRDVVIVGAARTPIGSFLGALASTSFGLSYFGRTHGLDEDAASSTLFIGTVIVGLATAAAAVPGGRLSDRFGRKPMIYVACAVAAVSLTA
jgi:MFS family permease